ncbi:MAG: fibronectin type III domain-containing protein [Candidatus Hydrogenedentes bacterium]|nr:fibronectin type III domain-containing protein [Candidatus Hydrogenedentota bacterium]
MEHNYDFGWSKHEHIRRSARSLGAAHSLYFSMTPWTPPTVDMEGLVSYYDPGRIAAMRKRLRGVDKKRYLRTIIERIEKPGMSGKERVAAICGFISDAIYYNPIQQPQENHVGEMLTDPVELLELHDGRCGQGVLITLALLEAAGIEHRSRNVFHHVTCEAKYDGKWHLADALMFGANQPERDGVVVNVAQLQRDPYFADAFPLRCFEYTPEELLASDGYRLLGYCFGDWGSLAYYSWYMGGDEDYPPMMPVCLPPLRLAGDRVRLRWAASAKRNGGAIRYRVGVYADRARAQKVFERVTHTTSTVFRVPEPNRMYFVSVAATDDHVQKNPNTWYPEAVGNFVLAPRDQYGWYGLL